MSPLVFISLLAGFVLLIGGAELLVRGASRLALSLGVPPILIGLTVVSLATSTPELAISLQSMSTGQADLAVGNVIGSNIANILLILGLSAAIFPLLVEQRLVRLDVPLMILASFALWFFARDGQVNRGEGAVLAAGLVGYLLLAVSMGRKEGAAVLEEYEHEYGGAKSAAARSRLANLALIAAGVALLVWGARLLVDSSVILARWFNLSEAIIGLTILAVGTGLPELATSLMAAWRREGDIGVGNAVGSNLFNILGVLGLTALLAPQGVAVSASLVRFDLPVMTAVAVACLPVFFIGHRISRWEGFLFSAYYLAYLVYLLLDAAQHDALPGFSRVMLGFVIPLTTVTLAVLVYRQLRSGAGSREKDQSGS